jgi:hypothetical protein
MIPTVRRTGALCALLILPLLFCEHAAAQNAADAAALAEYRLTDDGLAKFSQATRNLGAAVAADPGLEERMDRKSRDDATIAETAAIYDSEPAVRKAVEDADLTSSEYVTFVYSLAQAAMGAWSMQQYGEDKLPAGTPRENVDFYLANSDKIAALSKEMQALDKNDD